VCAQPSPIADFVSFFFFFFVTVEQISGMSEVTIDSMMGALQRLKEVRPLILMFLGYEN
jgi:hypothetical protein